MFGLLAAKEDERIYLSKQTVYYIIYILTSLQLDKSDLLPMFDGPM